MNRVADFLSLDPQVGRCPYPVFSALRVQPGIHYDKAADLYMVARHDDIVSILRDPVGFSSANALGPQAAQMISEAAGQLTPEQLRHLMTPTALLTADGEHHARLRRLTNAEFTVAAVRRWEDAIRDTCRELLARLPKAEPAEFVSGFARPLATRTIARVLGVPIADHPFEEWALAMVNLVNGNEITAEMVGAYLASAREFTSYFYEQVRNLRETPDDGLLSRLVHAEEQAEALSDEELVSLCVILLAAGVETMTGLITQALIRLAQDSALADDLRRDPSGKIPPFVEETLRLDAPAQAMFRTATRETAIAGTVIPAGAHLLLLLASGNRDASAFQNSETMDVRSPGKGHLAFSHGVHRCLGAALARTEARIAVEEALRAFSVITMARPEGELRFRPHLIGPGYEELWLDIGPAGRAKGGLPLASDSQLGGQGKEG